MLFNELGILGVPGFAVPEAKAQGVVIKNTVQSLASIAQNVFTKQSHSELGIVVILAENELLDDKKSYSAGGSSSTLREHIFAYAENIQKRLPHTRAIVMGVDKDESVFKISTVLEKMYYEGADNSFLNTGKPAGNTAREDDNRLVGVVIVGDVPMPVVRGRDGESLPSIYPYTDFYRKRFIYNHATGLFEENTNALKPTPDIWHGIIVPPSKDDSARRQQLAQYFHKNNQYSNDLGGYSDFAKRMLYYNFPAVEQKLNSMDYSNYKRGMKYLEEVAFKRFNKHLLESVIKDVAADTEPEKDEKDRTLLIDKDSIQNMMGIGVELTITKFMNNFAGSLNTYLGRLNTSIAETGRWSEKEYDSLASLITIRDVYMQNILSAKSVELENIINKEVQTIQEKANVINGIRLNIIMCDLDGSDCETKTFDFKAFSQGSKIESMTSVSQCGLMRGQTRHEGVSVLENNSLMVEANRMYNPDTGIRPKDDTKLENIPEYKLYAGCVANNSVKIDQDDAGIHLGPEKCKPDEAYAPIFDVAGSYEKNAVLYSASGEFAASAFHLPPEQCNLNNISFLQDPPPVQAHMQGFMLSPSNNMFDAEAYDPGFLYSARELSVAVDKVYDGMMISGEISPAIAALDTTYPAKLNTVARRILQSGASGTREFMDVVKLIRFNVQTYTKPLDSMVAHIEPSDKTLSQICASQVTRDTPSDGIRYVEFYKGGARQHYQYPNFFRIQGESENDITASLLADIKNKDTELNQLLGSQKNIISRYFLANPDLIEPIVWRQLGIDQKHKLVFEKYLNRNSFMPVPDPKAPPPATRPSGYEVLHVYADGDARGFKFAINASQLNEYALSDPDVKKAEESLASSHQSVVMAVGLEGTAEQEKLFSCGTKDGVEIWEWLPTLIGCWIPEEVTKLSDMVSLDSSCTGSGIPDPEDEEDAEDIFNKLMYTHLSFENPDNDPVKLEVSIDKKTLTRKEDVTVKVNIYNNKGKKVTGYIEDPLTFSVEDNMLLSFDKPSAQVFTGDGKAKLIAGGNSGKSNITVSLGALSSVTPITVLDGINIKLTYEKETGQPRYKITANLVDLTGKPITDVNTEINVSALNPADGKFVSPTIKLQDGSGEAVFYPNPESEDIKITSVHPVYTSDIITVPSIVNDPFKIVISAPPDIHVGGSADIPVIVTDVYGVISKGFTNQITVKVTDKSSDFGSVASEYISITEGKGVIKVKTGNETGVINLVASHSDLAPGSASIPIVAKITNEDLEGMFSQNLFASFVGFPAGNFLEEDYFGGAHLFNGKTEAVFAFMSGPEIPPSLTIMPNYGIKTSNPRQAVTVTSLIDSLSLQVIDESSRRSVIGGVLPLDFDNVSAWDEDSAPEAGTIYLELIEENHSSLMSNGEISVYDSEGEKILSVAKNSIKFINLGYSLFYESNSYYDFPELIILSPYKQEVGRLYLNYAPREIKPQDIIIDSGYGYRALFTGNSVNHPKGLVIYNKSETPDESKKLSENFGFEAENKYIMRFAGGSPAGEAVMWNLPVNAVLLGDPTIRLENKSSSSLNYDNTIGRQIYQDAEEGDIVAITNFDFNNDKIQDIAVVMKDGRIRLLEGGYTDPMYKDRGNIAFFSDGVISAASFDFKNDGYEDLVVSTREGRLAILHNDKEVITRTDQKIKVGKQLYQVIKADMDMDGYPDLVTLDSRGDIRIFYNKNNQIPENGDLLGNYGFSIKLGENLKNDLLIRYPNMPEPATGLPASPQTSASTAPSAQSSSDPYGLPDIQIPPAADFSALKNFASKDTSKDISESAARAFISAQNEAFKQTAESGGGDIVSTLPWREGDKTETYFGAISDFEINNSAFNKGIYFTAVKSVENRDRIGARDLDLGEYLKYTIKITAGKDINGFVLADVVPDSLALDEKSVECQGTGCSSARIKANGIYLFIGDLNIKAGKQVTITYEASVTHTPKPAIMIKTLDGTIKTEASIPLDNYKDILVSPSYNNTGQLIAHNSIGLRSYKITVTKKEEETSVMSAVQTHLSCIDELKKLESLKVDENTKMDEGFMDSIMAKCGLTSVQNSLKECKIDSSGAPPSATPEECAKDPAKCASNALNDAIDFISNFSCMGGGCFPMPFNMTFLAPNTIAIPALAFPATLPTPIGPLPVPSVFFLPTPIGASIIPGPIMSMIRLYAMPTLTGGIGMAFCWGPYTGNAPVPPPLIPIPYPPPIGNCMSFALPMSEMPHCKAMEMAITTIMEAANSVVSDINSGISAVNNSGLPVELEQKSTQQGAGGLEVGLAVNLGGKMKFEPPATGFANRHISSYDSILGKISGWVDRQMLEIFNKLLTLPTLQVVLPDVSGMLATDWDEFNKHTTAWWNNVSGTGRRAAITGNAIAGAATNIVSGFTGETNKNAGSGFLENYKAIEQEISAFNTSAIDDLYAIVNSIPFIKLNDHEIDFKIPYLSYAQIQDVIRDFEQAKIYYTKQVNKYKELLTKLTCPNKPTKTVKEIADCAFYQALSLIVVDVDALINSITENIAVLQSYLTFPRDVVLLKKQLAEYIKQLACVMETFSTMLGGWLGTIQDQIIGYVEVYYTIIKIFDNYKKLFKIFINFEDSCDICTNDRWSNFGWITLLGLVIPDIPIIKFPKWPDIVIDLSDFKAEINIEMPSIHFVAEPIRLPRIPRIPFPDVPDISFALQIPSLPVLPRLPEIPKLPDLPAVPTIQLPTLPPPPKLPDIASDMERVMGLVELLLKIWCMIKKSFTPVPEGYLGDHITLLTNRPAYLIPLDMLQIKFSDIGLLETDFNELRIETKIYMGWRLKMVLEKLHEVADEWNNNLPTDWSDLFDKAMQKAIGLKISDLENLSVDIDEAMQKIADKAEEGWEKNVQGAFDEFGVLMDDFDKQYFRKAEADMQEAFDIATNFMGDLTKAANQQMANSFSDFNKWADELNNELSAVLRKAASNTYFKWINAGFTGGLSKIDEMTDEDVRDWFQENALDEINKVFNAAVVEGTFRKEDCEKEFSKWTAEEKWMQELIDEAKKKVCGAETQAFINPYIASSDNPEAVIPPELKNTFIDTVGKLSETIENINNREPVDYTVLKKQYGIPDYRISGKPQAVVKIDEIREQLLLRAKEMEDELKESADASDLYAWVQSQLEPSSAKLIAGPEEKVNLVAALPEKSDPPKLIAQSAVTPQPSSSPAPSSGSSGVCVGTCLLDPKTGLSVQFIPYSDNPAIVQTAFIPSGLPGKSHVVYSDGPNLYLKRDISVPLSITANIAPRVPNIIFSLDDFLTAGSSAMTPKEAINMLATVLTEDSAANFSWKDVTNPDMYGVGIELERSILGYGADQQKNGLADVTIVLLPIEPDGSTPRVTVGDESVPYGSLITSLSKAEDARALFGIETRSIITGADKVLFRTIGSGGRNMGITLKPTRAVYFDIYNGSGHKMNMDNGFYQIKATWFDKYGRVANYNRNELLSPQIYVESSPPIDILFDGEFRFPVYKEGVISADQIFIDMAGNNDYLWDIDRDGLPEGAGSEFVIPLQKEPKEFSIDIIAGIKPDDTSFTQYQKELKVEIYSPEIQLEEDPLKQNGEIKGSMKPKDSRHDLTDIPFSIFRKRWGIWKNLGLLKQRRNTPTTPPLADKNGLKDNYYAISPAGDYLVKGFSHGPSNVLIGDETPKEVARVHLKTGQIEILDNDYEIRLTPASRLLPTRASVLKKGFDTVISNIYYVADSNTDAVILNEPLTQTNLSSLGVTLGDLNTQDPIIARNMPGHTESFPGGAAIFNKDTQINIALINTDGAVRMMSSGYSLRFKNQGKLDEKVILQLIDSAGRPVFDIFIAADFNNLVIKQDEIWNDLKIQIGYLKNKITPMFASLVAQSDTIIRKPATPSSPFPDVDTADPNYKAIIDLYQRRIISGYADGMFKPNAKISRAEFVKIALGATNCFDCSMPTDPQKIKYTGFAPFPDVSLPAWYYFCVAIAKELAMVTGYGDGYFRPDKNISRAEAAAVLLRQSVIEIQKAPESYFADVQDYAWYADHIYTAVKIGLVKETGGFVFPDEEITRGEFAFMASKILDLQDCRFVDTDNDGMPDWWEMAHNLDPFYSGDAHLDNDGDGFTNLEEYKRGTDPNKFDAPEDICPYIDNPNQNDTDGDGIIDVCDDDIDGDGIKNALGIFDKNGLIDPEKVAQSDDNCIFIANPGQEDSSGNGIGDACDFLPADQAGPPKDQCPEIPEDLDGYNDDDGCPELNDAIADARDTVKVKKASDYYSQTPGVYVNKGPLCYFLDYENDFVKDDIIMTAITDVITHDIIYSQSNEITY